MELSDPTKIYLNDFKSVSSFSRGANDLHKVQLMPLPPSSLGLLKFRMVYLSGDGRKRGR